MKWKLVGNLPLIKNEETKNGLPPCFITKNN
jgi:hypothetical protein